uniref:High-affinity zinc uptake system membrane protein znuB znuC n=1 Tax=Magnetococcus massalia (strain MO-1) TaxID=451514 RepID=A0A1S7LI21_MAGMO|nr:High-affinity zinc uptake system membrane protein znuB znuC [Candidatus Magnetococcus massalia]
MAPNTEQPSTQEPLLSAQGVCYSRNGAEILTRVDLQIHPGEVVTIVGPNGAGKSTLLKILLGILPPDSGQVIRKKGLQVGYVPQRMPVDPVLPLTVERLLKLAGRGTRQALLQALEETGVSHRLKASVQTLSGGELQRVLLARAMLCEPDVLVLDEPVQGVDYGGEVELYQLIADLRERHGWGVLLVSHDLHIVMRATDRVICLNRHICCTGTPDHVSSHPEFARLFGEHAMETLALYSHRHNHRHTIQGEVVPLKLERNLKRPIDHA